MAKQPTQQQWPAVIKLYAPIKANGEEISELTLKRPKVKHLKVIDGIDGDVEAAITLISKLADIPPSAVEDLDAEDMAACTKLLEGILKKK